MKPKVIFPLAALAASALFSTSAHAAIALPPSGPTITYVFTAAPDFTTALNGSSITISAGSIGAYNLIDSSLSLDYTPGNSSLYGDVISYNALGWSGTFDSYATAFSPYYFAGNGTSMDVDTSQFTFDPPGTWAAVGAAPDSSSTLPMLFGACAIIAGAMTINSRRLAPATRS